MLAEVRVAVATGRSEQPPCVSGRPIQCRNGRASRSGTTPSVTPFLRVRTERAERVEFSGSIVSAPAGELMVNHVRSERHLVRRGRQAVSRDTDDWFFVNLHQDGSCVLTQDGRDQQVNAGDLCLFDSTRPFDLDFPKDMALTSFLGSARRVARPYRQCTGSRSPGNPEVWCRRAPLSVLGGSRGGRFDLVPRAGGTAGTMFIDLLALAIGATSRRSRKRPADDAPSAVCFDLRRYPRPSQRSGTRSDDGRRACLHRATDFADLVSGTRDKFHELRSGTAPVARRKTTRPSGCQCHHHRDRLRCWLLRPVPFQSLLPPAVRYDTERLA